MTKTSNRRLKSIMKQEFKVWIKNMIFEFHIQTNTDMSFQKYLETSVFFMTGTFNQEWIWQRKQEFQISNSDQSLERRDCNYLYNAICRDMYCNDYLERKNLLPRLPMALVCMDFEGTRYSRGLSNGMKNAHFHGIWTFHPEDSERFRRKFPFLKMRRLDRLQFDKIVFDPYDPDRGEIDDLGTYVTKTFDRTFIDPIQGEIMRRYPDCLLQKSDDEPGPKYQTINRSLAKMKKAALSEKKSWGSGLDGNKARTQPTLPEWDVDIPKWELIKKSKNQDVDTR